MGAKESIPGTASGIEKPSYILVGWRPGRYDNPMPSWFLAQLLNVNKYTVFMYTVCKGGEYGLIGRERASDR